MNPGYGDAGTRGRFMGIARVNGDSLNVHLMYNAGTSQVPVMYAGAKG
jgi:hypothetical protein